MNSVRKRLTYANVMSSLAVFLVLGGATAFAANQLGKNTVGAQQLKKNAVTAAKIKKEAVTNAKIKKGTITGASLNLSSLGTVPSAARADTATKADSAAKADSATKADTAAKADSATVAETAKTLAAPEAENLVQGFATIDAGPAPTVINSGGRAVSGVSVERLGTGNYNVTFTGSFAGVTSIEDVATQVSVWDSNNFDVASASNDQSSASSSAIKIRVFSWSDNGDVPTPPLEDADFTVSFYTQ